MLYRRLGSPGLKLSALSFGAWVTFGDQIGRDEARKLIATAWDAGVNFFDNAEGYARGAEDARAEALAIAVEGAIVQAQYSEDPALALRALQFTVDQLNHKA